jgi:hypothetical protein
MEKIIQLPLTIPPPMPEDVDRYLAYMLDGVYDKPDAPFPPDGALAKFVALSIHWPQAIGWLWVKRDGEQSSLAWMEHKARELASNAKDEKEADVAGEASLKEDHFSQDWALGAEFRSFLVSGEVIGDYQGCRLWLAEAIDQ